MAGMTDQDYDSLEATDPLGLVRALIPDIEKLPDPAHPEAEASYLFGDATLGRFLLLSGARSMTVAEKITWTASTPTVYRAAANACETLARSEMLVLKKITTEDLATDGSVLAAQYRQLAAQLRAEADRVADEEADNDPGVFVVPFQRRPAQFDADVTARGALGWF